MIARFVDPISLLIVNPNISEATNDQIRTVAGLMGTASDEVEVVSANSGAELI